MILFVDLSSKKYAQKSTEAIQELKKIAPVFEDHFKVFYVNDDNVQKRLLGITWDELPALAFNSLDQLVLAYPRER